MTCVRPIKDQADAVPRAEARRVLAYEGATPDTTMGMQHGAFHANQHILCQIKTISLRTNNRLLLL